MEIALGVEYGSSNRISKWSGTIHVKIKGTPTDEDISFLNSLMKELNKLTKNKINFKITEKEPDMTIWFVPVDEMQKYEPNYVPNNWGFFYIWWNDSHEIYRANILIGTDKPDQKRRNHIIREEVTQSLGLCKDSMKYPDSIFYQGWTKTQEFADIDKKLIEILYSDDIRPGMTRSQVKKVLMQ
ncbi:DUF2927 domain-containing protein [candidate division WOR-3 bacterium]|nr:DUF2927 domain-containing protein [candidate division WOR-3 bacterium]